MTSISRRRLLALAGAASALSVLPAMAQDRRLRAIWWGGQDRTNRTQDAINKFLANNPGLSVDTESLAFSDYITRVSTQIAGGNAPDLIQMDYRYITEYAQRGTLEPLDDYIGKDLNLGDWPAAAIDSSRVDGKLYGINLGNNTNALFFDTVTWGKAGITEIPLNTEWTKFFDMAAEVTKANAGGTYFGANDASGKAAAFDNWARQKGLSVYNGQEAGTPAEAVAEWFTMWADARAKGAIPPADIAALDEDTVDSNLIVQGYAGTAFVHSNSLIGYQKTSKNPLDMTTYPQGAGPHSGQYLKPSQMWSIYSGSPVKQDAIKLANFMVSEQEGALALGLERGVPASASIQDALRPTLDELNTRSLDYVVEVTKTVSPIPAPPPRGATEAESKLKEISQMVAFGQLTPEQGGQQYYDEANGILARA